MNNKELVAYQTVDIENKHWRNEVLLFETQEKADEFFKDKMNIFNALGYELEGEEKEEDIIYNNISDSYRELYCSYAHKTIIVNIMRGIFIK